MPDYSKPYAETDLDDPHGVFIACGHCDNYLTTRHPCGDQGRLECTHCGGEIDLPALIALEQHHNLVTPHQGIVRAG